MDGQTHAGGGLLPSSPEAEDGAGCHLPGRQGGWEGYCHLSITRSLALSVLATEDAGPMEPLDALDRLVGLRGRRHGDKGALG